MHGEEKLAASPGKLSTHPASSATTFADGETVTSNSDHFSVILTTGSNTALVL